VDSDAAADEMDDLDRVAFRKAGLRPLLSGNNVEIEFYSDPVRFQTHLRNQIRQGERAVDTFGLTVDLQLHERNCRKGPAFRQTPLQQRGRVASPWSGITTQCKGELWSVGLEGSRFHASQPELACGGAAVVFRLYQYRGFRHRRLVNL
jgi:hypothetical protein